jgi:hypothetical protein
MDRRILRGHLTVKMRVSRRVHESRRTVHVDTQRLREKTIRRLEEIFKIGSDYAHGKVDRVTDDSKNSPTHYQNSYWKIWRTNIMSSFKVNLSGTHK